MTTALIQDTEPTPEFYSRSIAIMNRWQSGELPFDDAAQSLAVMNQEAVLDSVEDKEISADDIDFESL